MIPNIKQGFTNQNGKSFDKIREISYKKGELSGNLGILVADTGVKGGSDSDSFFSDNDGVLIYQSRTNPFVAYRIYRAYAEYGFNGCGDDKLIQALMERQPGVLLTKFPTGVVTFEQRIIGQEIPYYPNDITLARFLELYKNVNPLKIYRTVLKVLKEMYDNGIIYLDIHPGNFMLNPNLPDIKINTIDFDETYIKIDNFTAYNKERFFYNYKTMIDKSNKLAGLDNKLSSFLTTNNFDDTYGQLDAMEKTLLKKK